MSTQSEQRKALREQLALLQELSDVHLECRVGGVRHRWHRVKPVIEFDVGLTRAFQCDNCLCLKHTSVSVKYGEQLRKPVYWRPEGYGLSARVSSDAVRAAVEQRVNFDDLPEALPVPRKEMS